MQNLLLAFCNACRDSRAYSQCLSPNFSVFVSSLIADPADHFHLTTGHTIFADE